MHGGGYACGKVLARQVEETGNIGLGSTIRAQRPSEPGLECTAESTFGTERRQCGGFRAFQRSGLNSRFVPKADVAAGRDRAGDADKVDITAPLGYA